MSHPSGLSTMRYSGVIVGRTPGPRGSPRARSSGDREDPATNESQTYPLRLPRSLKGGEAAQPGGPNQHESVCGHSGAGKGLCTANGAVLRGQEGRGRISAAAGRRSAKAMNCRPKPGKVMLVARESASRLRAICRLFRTRLEFPPGEPLIWDTVL